MQTIHYVVYKITNTANNKIYIGCHKTKNVNDNYMGSGLRLHYAKKKYGEDAFKKEILSVFSNKEDMLAEEARLVDTEFLKRPDVYNLNRGGGGSWDRPRSHRNRQPLSEETKQKISLANKGNQSAKGSVRTEQFKKAVSEKMQGKQHALGCKRTPEHLAAISKAHTGRVFSEEARRKMSESKMGNKNRVKKPSQEVTPSLELTWIRGKV